MNHFPQNITPLQRYRLLGKSGLRVSPLCLGTMTWGTAWTSFTGACTKESARDIFSLYVASGGNFFDTANAYQLGEAESWLGEFIQTALPAGLSRDDLVIATKFSLPCPPGHVNATGNHRKNLVRSIDASLARLRTSYVDLLYVHFYDGTVDADELVRSLQYVVQSGKVLHVAISDAPAWFVSRCVTIAELRGFSPFVAYQGRFNAADRDCEAEILPMCRALGLAFIPWSVLAAGRLASKSRANSTRGSGELTELQERVHATVCDVADALGKSVAAVAVSWTAATDAIASVMIGARSVEQLKDAIDGIAFRLADADQQRISDAGQIVHQFPHRFLEGADFTTIGWLRPGGLIVPHFDAPVLDDDDNNNNDGV
jgi:aryl-alcohol dehydrogenase-like predicted oxidoreductase